MQKCRDAIRIGDQDGYLRAIEHAITATPNRRNYWYDYVIALYSMRRISQADELLDSLLALPPRDLKSQREMLTGLRQKLEQNGIREA